MKNILGIKNILQLGMFIFVSLTKLKICYLCARET